MLRAFLSKISSKLKKLKTNLKDKVIFILKISKSELINSTSEYEKNGTEESETSDTEYFSDFTKLQLHMYKPCLPKFHKRNCPEKESSDSEEDTSRIGNTLWCCCGKHKL